MGGDTKTSEGCFGFFKKEVKKDGWWKKKIKKNEVKMERS